MRLKDLFEQTYSIGDVRISPNELDTLQLRTYNRIKGGEVDLDTADEKELDIIFDLIDLGVLDQDGNIIDDASEFNDEVSSDDFSFDVSDEDSEDLGDVELDFQDDNDDIEFH